MGLTAGPAELKEDAISPTPTRFMTGDTIFLFFLCVCGKERSIAGAFPTATSREERIGTIPADSANISGRPPEHEKAGRALAVSVSLAR